MGSQRWRPSWPRYLAFARFGLIVVGVALAAGLVTLAVSRTAALAIAPIEVVVVGTGSIAFGSQTLRIRRSRLDLDEDWVNWRGVFGRVRLRRSELRGLLTPVSQPMTAPTRMLLLTDGRQRIRLVAGLWDEGDLGRIADSLGIETSWLPQPARAVERTVPGSTSVFARHPWRTSLAAAFGILVVVSVVATVVVLNDPGADDPVARGPATVSAATVADQTQTISQVEAAFGRRGWRPATIALWTCGGENGEPAGWLRHADVLTTGPAEVPRTTEAAVQAILRRHGYTLLDPDRVDDTVVLDGVGEGLAGADVEVQLGRDVSSIELTGPCES